MNFNTDGTALDVLTVTVNDLGNTGQDPSEVGLTGTGDTTSEEATVTIPITVVSVNDPPVITHPATQSVDEDTDLVFSGSAISISDVDAGEESLRVSLSVTSGTLTLSITSGLTIESGDDGTDELTFTGSLTNLNAALDGLVYRGNPNYFGSDALIITVDDLGNSGAIGGPQQTTETVDITVNPVNDTPTVEALALSTDEDTAVTFKLTSFDVDGGTNETTDAVVVSYKITSLPSDGTLTVGGDPVTPDTVIAAEAPGDNPSINPSVDIVFTPAANFNGEVVFDYIAIDAADAESTAETVTITVIAVNDAPVLAGGGDTVDYTEGDGLGATGTATVLNAADRKSVV